MSKNVLDDEQGSIRFVSILLVSILSLSVVPISEMASSAQDNQATGLSPEEIWSEDYANMIFPWAPANDQILQFKEYHSYETMKNRMMFLAQANSDIFEYHEGMPGGMNARGEETTIDTYEGWYYGHASPWLKITGDVNGGEYNPFVGDSGNYADRPDVLIVGNHHAREWMSYTVALMQMEVIAFSYENIGYDNDGDGEIDEDPWGDEDGDGILDDDGDCLSLAAEYQDSNGDGNPCGPGDLGVDEDYSEQFITDLVNNREIYLIPMLNVDGNIYDREVFCVYPAWETCPSGGWRKNLRNNGPELLPDPNEQVDEDCDGVDLNRNYQFEWGWPLGATVPLIPGTCTPAEDERAGITNNDVYTGPYDTRDNDGDGLVNEDNVDGEDDDNDGQTDEDWAGGNSEPETKFIQDMTEMNDDSKNGASEFKATLTHHSYSELILYPWGHCTGCQTTDHNQLVYHGDILAEMTDYTNMQSSDLYPTTGDFCDWHYGVHGSYCYTSEIGTAFHQHRDDVDHIAVRNLGTGFYIAEIADNPRERADMGLADVGKKQYISSPENITIPEIGEIPIDICIASSFYQVYSGDKNVSHVMWRVVTPTRLQSDYGPTEWSKEEWKGAELSVVTNEKCQLAGNSTNPEDSNGTLLRAMVPVPDDVSGQLHYKAVLGTLSGTSPFEYPSKGGYYVLEVPYRAAYGNFMLALILFALVASAVWGGLGACLNLMMGENELVAATQEEMKEG